MSTGTPRKFSVTDYDIPPHFAETYTNFSSNIDLTQRDGQTPPRPTLAATSLYLVNKDVSTSFASFTVVIGNGCSIVLTIPPQTAKTFRGAFTAITSVSGGTNPEATAFWHVKGAV